MQIALYINMYHLRSQFLHSTIVYSSEVEHCMYIYICQDGGAVGFVEFTKLLFALSSLAQPLKRVRSIP